MTAQPVRWGVLGPGGIAAQFAEALQHVDGGTIVAVASRDQQRADAFAHRFGIPRPYGSHTALAADPEIDIVYVATPHARHAPGTIAMLEAGKHVLCEKPFAVDTTQALEMFEIARRSDRFLMEAMWSRFLPAYDALVARVDVGEIGDVLAIDAEFGFRMPVVPEHRLFDRALGGGALLDVGVYPVQLCTLLAGEPVRVAATAHIGQTEVDEIVAATLAHPNGTVGIVKAAIRANLANGARITGSKGTLALIGSVHNPSAIELTNRAGTTVIDTTYEGHGLRFQIAAVQQCLRAGMRECPTMPADETLVVMRTLDRIREEIGLVYASD